MRKRARLAAARRAPEKLNLLASDADFRVRFVCAERMPREQLGRLMEDGDEIVRDVALGPLRTGET